MEVFDFQRQNFLNTETSANTDIGKKGRKQQPNIFAFIALAAGIAGWGFCLFQSKARNQACLFAGLLATLMLLAVMIQMRVQMNSQMKDNGKTRNTALDMNMVLKLKFTPWYYLSLISFLSASFFCYRQHAIEKQDAMQSLLNLDLFIKTSVVSNEPLQ